MSNADRTCAASIALSSEDQDRLFSIAIAHRGSILTQEPPIDAQTPHGAAAATLRRRAVRTAALADVVEATTTGTLAVTPAVREFLQHCRADTAKWLDDERKILQMAASGVEVYPGMSAQRAAEEARDLTDTIEADAALLDRLLDAPVAR